MITAYAQYTLQAFLNWHNLILYNRAAGDIHDEETLSAVCLRIVNLGNCSHLNMVHGINHKSPIVEELVSRGASVKGTTVLVPGDNPNALVHEALVASLKRYAQVNKNRFYSDSKYVTFSFMYIWDYIIGSSLIIYLDPKDLDVIKSGSQISAYSKSSWDRRKKRHSKTGGIKVPTSRNVILALQHSFQDIFPELYKHVPRWSDHHCGNEVRLWSGAVQNSKERIAQLRQSLELEEQNLEDNIRRLEEAKGMRVRLSSDPTIPREEVDAYCSDESNLVITQVALEKVASNPELYSGLNCCLGQYAKDLLDL